MGTHSPPPPFFPLRATARGWSCQAAQRDQEAEDAKAAKQKHGGRKQPGGKEHGGRREAGAQGQSGAPPKSPVVAAVAAKAQARPGASQGALPGARPGALLPELNTSRSAPNTDRSPLGVLKGRDLGERRSSEPRGLERGLDGLGGDGLGGDGLGGRHGLGGTLTLDRWIFNAQSAS